ncbi:MAG: hypothetical protein LC808_44830 [Actinobacteria bacterium]|nr:hypothetical protein [Actinomycetota bacterium]
MVVQGDTHRFDVDVDEHRWFYVFLEGREPVTITADDHSGRLVLELDGPRWTTGNPSI